MVEHWVRVDPVVDAQWREVDDPGYNCRWRCRNLVFEYHFYNSVLWWARDEAPGRFAWCDPTPERVALWEDLFLHPGP